MRLVLFTIFCYLCSASPAPLTIQLQGNFNTFFMHYFTLAAGTPSTQYTVIFDTGSSDLMIPDANCSTCPGDPSKFYNATTSSTSLRIPCNDKYYHCASCSTDRAQCQYTVQLVGISEDALLVQDYVSLISSNGQINTTRAVFGSITNIDMGQKRNAVSRIKEDIRLRNLHVYQDDYPEGIVGFAYPVLSSSGALPIFDTFVQNLHYNNVFSLCFNGNGHGGLLQIGGVLPYYSGNMQYTPLVSEDFYSVQMVDILVAGISLGLQPSIYNTKHCITDSGTPMPTLPSQVFNTIIYAFQTLCNSSYPNMTGVCGAPSGKSLFDGVCFPLTADDINQFPLIQFVLNGNIVLDYPPTAYLKSWWTCQSGVGLGLQSDPSGFGSVIGLSVLNNYVTVYDRTNKLHGFAPRNGPTCS
eukprot:TRINITY_DN7524_c0_g6_i2.p1 TRINITY_DN7524_c0_g6~~TRINITY_DN7524_c0_g6_i2.p1  ORF type:complete len:412 (+),score=63.08 TRINITY_DN7524_c0_g6_i2:216-1451(+)